MYVTINCSNLIYAIHTDKTADSQRDCNQKEPLRITSGLVFRMQFFLLVGFLFI